MSEKIISLVEIDYPLFWGTNDKILEFVKLLFPKLKLIVRGEMLKVVGADEDITLFETKLQALISYYEQHGKLTEDAVMRIFENGGSTPEAETTPDILVHGRNGNLIKARTPGQHQLVQAIQNNDVTIAIGPAGTGKTYTAVAMAVRALKNKEVRRIVLTRPAVEAGERLGFLPGDLQDKVDPYLRPLYDGLYDMLGQETVQKYLSKGIIEVAPLAYMRGRTLNEAYIILDEAQNTTPEQMKMFLTRFGFGSKMVITGDVTQIDLPGGKRSGLIDAAKILRNVQGIGVIKFTEQDVVRHEIVGNIIKAYEKFEKSEQ